MSKIWEKKLSDKNYLLEWREIATATTRLFTPAAGTAIGTYSIKNDQADRRDRFFRASTPARKANLETKHFCTKGTF